MSALKGYLVVALCGLFALCGTIQARATEVIDNPGRGMIVYGPVTGVTTEAAAMGAVLRSVHQDIGDKPRVGKLFRVRGTNSVTVFFTATKRTQNNMPVAGMLIVSKVSRNDVEAALLTDKASRFGNTINPMLKSLFAVWHPGGVAQAGPMVGPQPLRKFMLQDGSAWVGLPQGWRVTPQSGGGTIIAEGPNGETALLGYPLLAMDINNPQGRRAMMFAQGAGRNTAYARTLYYPYGMDPARAFVDLFQMLRQKSGLPPMKITVGMEAPMQGGPTSRCAHLTGRLDVGDGKGPKEFNTVFCTGLPQAGGSYMNLAYHVTVPAKLADRERATMGAILASFGVNEGVIQREAAIIAAPAIAQIHAIGQAAERQANEAHAANDRYNQGVAERGDSQEKRNQSFDNYLLDQSVIEDKDHNAHGTVWNDTADALVHSNPNRFDYVNTPNYWKGIDY
jgi:hypothetical protein